MATLPNDSATQTTKEFKSGFGMAKTNIPAVPVDFDVSVFAKPEDYGIIIPEGSTVTINISPKLN
ncbi:hypothetical protein [Moraxella oblonga]|uniref:hypothetical protein n=1 Tax=Moraxella oblonga TaxID=200413 RepID=UPI00082F44E0|nr:hypothetical protein [Moraxella oblonga]